MKVEIDESEQLKEFKPFSITFNAETIEDARLLFHLVDNNDIRETLKIDSDYWNDKWSGEFTKNLDKTGKLSLKIKAMLESQGFII